MSLRCRMFCCHFSFCRAANCSLLLTSLTSSLWCASNNDCHWVTVALYAETSDVMTGWERSVMEGGPLIDSVTTGDGFASTIALSFSAAFALDLLAAGTFFDFTSLDVSTAGDDTRDDIPLISIHWVNVNVVSGVLDNSHRRANNCRTSSL